MNARHAIGPPGVTGDRRNARRRAAPQPRIVTAARSPQHPAHRRHPVFGLIRLHEREDPPGAVSVSRTNQAAAFLSISRSSRGCRFSRHERRSSSRSAVVRPSVRRPPSNCGSPAPSIRTPATTPSAYDLCVPTPSSAAGTPAHTVSTSSFLLTTGSRCPHKRVNSNLR